MKPHRLWYQFNQEKLWRADSSEPEPYFLPVNQRRWLLLLLLMMSTICQQETQPVFSAVVGQEDMCNFLYLLQNQCNFKITTCRKRTEGTLLLLIQKVKSESLNIFFHFNSITQLTQLYCDSSYGIAVSSGWFYSCGGGNANYRKKIHLQ